MLALPLPLHASEFMSLCSWSAPALIATGTVHETLISQCDTGQTWQDMRACGGYDLRVPNKTITLFLREQL